MHTSFSRHWVPTTGSSFIAIQNMGYGYYRTNKSAVRKKPLIYSCNYQLVFQMIWNYHTQKVKVLNVLKFTKHHIIYHFGVSRQIIHDNGSQSINQVFNKFCDRFKNPECHLNILQSYCQRFSRSNMTIIKLLRKLIDTIKCDCHEMLGEYLWGHCTTIHSLINSTPYS